MVRKHIFLKTYSIISNRGHLLSYHNENSSHNSRQDGDQVFRPFRPLPLGKQYREPDFHKATFYANVHDLWLFLFDSRNYYMDCIRMDENHILFVVRKAFSAVVRNRFSPFPLLPVSENDYFSSFAATDYMLVFWIRYSFFLLPSVRIVKHTRMDRRLALLLFLYIFMVFLVRCLRHLLHFLSFLIQNQGDTCSWKLCEWGWNFWTERKQHIVQRKHVLILFQFAVFLKIQSFWVENI